MIDLPKPSIDEHAPYMSAYIQYVKQGTIDEVFQTDQREIAQLFAILDEDKATYRYATDKWTVKQTIIHCMDTERIFAGRALMIARADEGKLPGYDHDAYAAVTVDDQRTLNHLQEEWQVLRKSNLLLFKGFSPEALKRIGNANNFPLAARAVPFIITGHNLHHMAVLRTKYRLNF